MRGFLEAHGYDPESIKIRKVTSCCFKEHVDPLTYGLLAGLEDDQPRLRAFLRMCDFLQFQILKRALVTIVACQIYLEGDDEKSLAEYKQRHKLE
jgi:hypothetical protein